MVYRKDIPGYEGIYYATSDGKIFSYKRKLPTKNRLMTINARERKQCVLNNGYLVLALSNNLGHKQILVHRLIAMTFIPNPDNKPMVNHKDGNKQNNDVSNLEWVTRRENEDHATVTGLKPSNERNGASKISNVDAEFIRKNYKKRNNAGKLAQMFGITCHQVRRIAVGESRKLLSASG